ncbi:MAG: methyltransferase domain-containing protein [bacterium]|nr:methyltransferase domain-containing protein [bacterium]
MQIVPIQRPKTAKQEPRQSVVTGFAHPARNVAGMGITPGMKVADFGSGSGAYVLAIAEMLCNSGHVYAIDVQRDLLRRIKNEMHKRGFKNVEVIWGDLERAGGSKIAVGVLDVVLISNLLFQVDEKRVILEEARRILKPQGRLVIIDWSDSFKGTGPRSADVVDKETALSIAVQSGFQLIQEFSAGAHHYGLIFRKK